MFRFTIRDVLWLTVVVAVALGVFFARANRRIHWEYRADPAHAISLDDAGAEGWELVTVAQLSNEGPLMYYFKRPK